MAEFKKLQKMDGEEDGYMGEIVSFSLEMMPVKGSLFASVPSVL